MSCPEKDFDLVIVGNCGNAELVPGKENNDIQAPRIPLFTVSFRSTLKVIWRLGYGFGKMKTV